MDDDFPITEEEAEAFFLQHEADMVTLPATMEEALVTLIGASLGGNAEQAFAALQLFDAEADRDEFLNFLSLLVSLNQAAIFSLFGQDEPIPVIWQETIIDRVLDGLSSWYPVPIDLRETLTDVFGMFHGETDGMLLINTYGPFEACLYLGELLTTLLIVDDANDDPGDPFFLVPIQEESIWREVENWDERLGLMLYVLGFRVGD